MGRVTPYRYGQEGLARVGEALVFRTARPRRWPAITAFAIFVGIFCRADALRGFAAAAPNPAARSNEMNLRMAGAVSAMVVAGAASAQNAVQWRIEDGGNGHWYRIVVHELGRTWEAAADAAAAGGGHLATLTSAVEHEFAMSLVGTSGSWFAPGLYPDVLSGPWLGARRASLASPWMWITGEPWSYTAFCSNQPSNQASACSQPETCLYVKLGSECFGSQGWGDITPDGICAPEVHGLTASLVEFSADCNSDGIVDYGQIRAGDLADTNANNIPDCCETGTVCGCPADVILDGVVNGIDLAVIINAWSTDGGKFPRADIDGNGLVDGADLAIVLGSWGPCS
jgi:hypothetical protein